MGAGLAIALLASLKQISLFPYRIAPLGASATLVCMVPDSPLARAVIGASLISAAIVLRVLSMFFPTPWAMGLAVGPAIFAKVFLHVLHAPAGALPLVIGISHPDPFPFLATLAASTCILVGLGRFYLWLAELKSGLFDTNATEFKDVFVLGSMTKMLLSRRTALIGLSAVAVAPAFAQARFEAAKAYSTARRGISFLVMQRGQVLVEDYQGQGLRFKGWELASGTKSFSGVMAAALVQDGLLELDEDCAETLPEFRSDRYRSAIRVADLLHLVSGIDGKGGRSFGDVPTYAEALAAPSNRPTGSQFSYGPVPFQIFGELVRRKLVTAKTGDADPLAYLTRRLFTPLGIRPIRWQRGSDGMPHLPSGAAITARDWAKFGQFVLAGGVHEGKALVDSAALKANFEASKVNPGYGLTWWMPRPGMIGPGPRSGVAGEAVSLSGLGTLYMAAGAGNQRLYLLPDQDLVIVRQADGIAQSLRGGAGDWSDQQFLSLILGA